MIELRDLGFGYDDDSAPVLSGVDLRLEEGELVLVSGRTGVGKSTLLGVLTGLVPGFTGGRLSGEVLLNGESIIDAPPRERAHLIGSVGQDPAAGFVTDTVEEELAYGMEQLGLPGETMRRRVEETLDLLGIADLRQRDLRTLSGGQQQRVALGSVLTMHPRVLVLDEPTSALDPTAAEDVLATITRLVHDLGLTVVLAEHRLERVIPFADRMLLLDGAGGVVAGDPAELLATSPVVPPIIELGRALGWEPLPLTVRDARRRASSGGVSGVESPPAGRRVGTSGASSGEFSSTPVLTARRLTVTHGRTVAVREVDLELASGRITALMGRNGSGKSSLIWALQGSRPRHTGTVLISPRQARTQGPGSPHSTAVATDPAEVEGSRRRELVGLVPQTAADLLYLESVAEECEAADAGAGRTPGSTRALLDRMVPGIGDAQHPRDLSEGQRLALVLAIVLATEPPVLLLDEPTRGLDYPAKQTLAAILTDLTARGRAVLVASHDVEFVAGVADDVVVLAEGEVVSAGEVRRVLAESPSFAPQVTKILGPGWLTVDEVVGAVG